VFLLEQLKIQLYLVTFDILQITCVCPAVHFTQQWAVWACLPSSVGGGVWKLIPKSYILCIVQCCSFSVEPCYIVADETGTQLCVALSQGWFLIRPGALCP